MYYLVNKKIWGSLMLASLFFFALVPYSIGNNLGSNEALGYVAKVDTNKLSITTANETITVLVKDSSVVSVNDYVKIIYHPLTDNNLIFVAEEIEIMKAN